MFKKKIIRVEFIDAESGEVIGYDEQSVKKLPETFEHSTSVEIGEEKYEVVKATPDTRKKFRKKGELTIELAKIKPAEVPVSDEWGMEDDSIEEAVEYGNQLPTDKVYQAASRADLFPAFTGNKDGKDLIVMGSWEWRQLEFVSTGMEEQVAIEIRHIQDIRANHNRWEAGRIVFTQQHRRSEISSPLKGIEFSSQELKEHFPFSIHFDGLTFMAAEGYGDGGFALRTQEGLELYGLEFAGQVKILSLRCPDSYSDQEKHPAAKLSAFMENKGLMLVDWEQCLVVQSDTLEAYLLPNAKVEVTTDTDKDSEE